MPTPPSSPIHPDGSGLVKWIKGIESAVRLLGEKLNHVFDGTGLSVPSTGVTQVDQTFNVLGTQNVSGNLNVSGTETVSGSLNVTGNETVGGTLNVTGNTIIGGTLSLPAGIIGNDSLANPTAFGFGGNSTGGFGVGTTATAKSSIAIPIPTGFSRALVHCTVNGSAQNSTGSLDFLYVSASITLPGGGGGSGGEAFAGVTASGWGNAGASAAGSYTGIGTGNIVVACQMRAGTAWAATGANIANVDATVTFLR